MHLKNFSVATHKRAVRLANIGIAITTGSIGLYMLVEHYRLDYDEYINDARNVLAILGLITGLVLSYISLTICKTRRAGWLRAGILIIIALSVLWSLLFKDFSVIC